MGINMTSGGVELLEDTETKTSHAPVYNVIMHNDDKTTMDFVVFVLHNVFKKDIGTAMTLMLQIHHKGQALVGTYPSFEYAELKADQAHSLARAKDFPLTCTIEKA